MKKSFSSISMIVILMIVMSSIIQFHHHDNNGNIIFAVTTICCDEGNSHHYHRSHTDCCKCEHHHDHDCGSGENCSAHLGDYQATKQTSLSINDSPTLILIATLGLSESKLSPTNFDCKQIYIHNNTPVLDGVTSALSLRAPPTC